MPLTVARKLPLTKDVYSQHYFPAPPGTPSNTLTDHRRSRKQFHFP